MTALAFITYRRSVRFRRHEICIALTRFPRQPARLYAADLAGSAAGCVSDNTHPDHIHAPRAVHSQRGIAMLGCALLRLSMSGRQACLGLAFQFQRSFVLL